MALATNTTPGEIQLAGDLDGTSLATAPELKCTTVTPGSYNFAKITVDAKGRLTLASEASQAEIDSVVPTASAGTPGLVTVGTGLSVDGSGNITADVATTSSKGVVQVGSGLEVVNGVISVDEGQLGVADATTSTKGIVQIGSGLDVNAGVVSLDPSVTADATTSTKGIVQIGSGLDVNAGVVSLDETQLSDATTSSKGIVQIDDSGALDITAGVVSFNESQLSDATTSSKGIVQIDDSGALDITAGVVSFNESQLSDATTSSKGIVQIGSGLNVSAGVVDVDTSTVATIDGGNTYTKAQNVQEVALSSGANVSVDASLSNVFTLTLTTSGQLDNPTNLQPGSYTFIVKQDGIGTRNLTFGTNYKFKNGFDNSIATDPNSVSIISCVATSTELYCAVAKEFV